MTQLPSWSVIGDVLRETLQRRTPWRLEQRPAGPRLAVPRWPGPIVLLVLLAATAVVVGGVGAMIWFIQSRSGWLVALPFVLLAPVAGALSLAGVWHLVLFSHFPESRKPDAVRVEGSRVAFPRSGVEVPASACVMVVVVARPDPPGFENRSDAVREEIRVVVREDGAERPVVAVPYGSRLNKLADRLGRALGVPVERTQGPPWSLDEVRGSPGR